MALTSSLASGSLVRLLLATVVKEIASQQTSTDVFGRFIHLATNNAAKTIDDDNVVKLIRVGPNSSGDIDAVNDNRIATYKKQRVFI